jgi:hypothetical protein
MNCVSSLLRGLKITQRIERSGAGAGRNRREA